MFIIVYFILIIKTNIKYLIVDILSDKYTNNNIDLETYFIKTSISSFKMLSITSETDNDSEIINDILNVSYNIDKPLIYIYNTHDSEKYKLNYISDYSITPSVKVASYILKDHLNDIGISSYVETNSIKDYLNKNKLSYYYSYDGSRKYLLEAKELNDYKIYIDIHRDSIKYDKSTYQIDNTKYAKILFVLAKKNPNYSENEKFIKELNNILNSKYNGISRGILNRNDVIFNQDISSKSILIEIGGVDNSIEEVNNTLYVFSLVLKEYIDKEGLNG